jgi:cystathionine gamma-synthase
MQKGDVKKAEVLTNKVLNMKVADDFKAMAYLQLINISSMQLQRDPKNQIVINRIKELHAKTKKLNISTPQVKEQLDQVDLMCNSSRLITNATSLGGVESIWERRRRWATESASVPENLIRFSVGIENVDDLWADIEHAFTAAKIK